MAQVTEGLSQTAAHATSVQRTVDAAHRTASDGGAVVQRAIAAMAAIETSSREISQIINVIDGIAFQTNLLALNAGVEAARAGESGKGFAVVANEVRALAQRSADAAHNIKSLINNSSGQVDQGVALVGETGTQLTAIVTQVAEMSSLASSIANATEQQAASLRQVHTAIRDMDLSTQQNAAMVEQSSAAAVALETEAQSLTALVATFRTRKRDERKHSSAGLRRTTSAEQAVVRSSQIVRNVPAPTLPAPRPQVSGNLALAEQRDDWAEF
jgi:methyl-accepting chemotaxis protein